MPRVSDQYKQERIRSLYRATWACIAQKGLQRLTLDDVLEASGASAGMVYNYFGGRDELVNAAMDGALAQLRDALAEALTAPAASPAGLFVAVLDAFDRKAVDEPFAMAAASVIMNSRAPLQEPEPAVTQRYGEFIGSVEAQATRWIDDGVVGDQATPRQLAELMISLLLGYFSQFALLETKSRDGHLAALAALGQAART